MEGSTDEVGFDGLLWLSVPRIQLPLVPAASCKGVRIPGTTELNAMEWMNEIYVIYIDNVM